VSVKNEDQVEVIAMDQPTPSVVAQINAGDQPWHLVPDLANNRSTSTSWGDSRVNLIDLSFPVIAAGVTLDDRPVGMALEGGALWAVDGTSSTTLGGDVGFSRTESGRLTQLDPVSLAVLDEIPLGVAPAALAAGPGVFAMAAPTGDGAVIVDLTPACTPADLAPPFGVLDLADLTAFVTAFLAGDPAADFAPPAGVLDLADLTAFVVSFTGGCP
jgi:hypothetical protein